MKSPEVKQRINQLVDEIGRPLWDQAVAEIGAHEASRDVDVEAKWFAILEKLDETKDPSVLLPLLNVPDEVRPHFRDALEKRLMLCHRTGHGKTIPSYLPMSLTEATARLLATYVRYLKGHGVSEDKAVELMALVHDPDDDKLPDKLRDINSGKVSSARNQRARRARARGTPG
jgi:hypothetical protein